MSGTHASKLNRLAFVSSFALLLSLLSSAPAFADGPPAAAASWVSLAPALLAILLALVIRQVIPALFAGVWLGAWAIEGFSAMGLFTSLLDTFQVHVLQATADPDHAAIILFSLMIAGTAPGESNSDIDYRTMIVAQNQRLSALVNVLLMEPDAKTLIFVRTRMDTTGLSDALADLGFAARPLSGDLNQRGPARIISYSKDPYERNFTLITNTSQSWSTNASVTHPKPACPHPSPQDPLIFQRRTPAASMR